MSRTIAPNLPPPTSNPLGAAPAAPSPARTRASRPPAEGMESAFRGYLASLSGTVARGEALVGGVVRGDLGGDALSPARLIGLQAEVYRYTQALELASRLVDRTTGAVKQTLQSQG